MTCGVRFSAKIYKFMVATSLAVEGEGGGAIVVCLLDVIHQMKQVEKGRQKQPVCVYDIVSLV